MTTPPEEFFEKIEACIHCGMCLPTCPTYRVTGSEAESPRGRLYLMKAFMEGQLDSPQQLAAHLDPCLGCLACVTVCPSGVRYDTLLMASREKLVPSQSPFKRKIRRFFLQKVLPHPKTLSLFVRATLIYERSGLQWLVRKSGVLNYLGPLGWLEQSIPQIQAGQPLKPGLKFGENRRGRVALFTGCLMNAVYHRTHLATIDVLVANGYQVVIPEQTCCGALAHHSGETDIAASLAAQNLTTMLAAEPDWIVVNAAGCGSTLKEYQDIVSNHPLGSEFSTKVVDIMELLAKQPLEGEPVAPPLTVTYHAACHLHHAQGVQDEPYQVLKQIAGLKLIPLIEADMCCGSAGVYNIAHPDLSGQILAEKMMHLEKTQADVVLAANPGCMLQLESGIRQTGLSMKVMHPVELLALAYRPHAHITKIHRVK